MVAIVVATHGELSSALIQAAEMITGPADGVYSVPLLPGESPETYSDKLAALLDRLQGQHVLILLDLFGGTPYNVAARYVLRENTECVTGANLPMLLELLLSRDNVPFSELARSITQIGSESIRNLGPMLRK